jgi:hypothetical protein
LTPGRALFSHPVLYWPTMEDKEFERSFEKEFAPLIDERFFSKIAGVTHPNRDGSDRAEILRRCQPLDILELIPEPDNPVDPKAIAIWRYRKRFQLGYLPKETAHELLRRMDDSVGRWVAVLRDPYCAEDSDRIVGATIVVMHMTVEKIRKADSDAAPKLPDRRQASAEPKLRSRAIWLAIAIAIVVVGAIVIIASLAG